MQSICMNTVLETRLTKINAVSRLHILKQFEKYCRIVARSLTGLSDFT